MYQKLSFLSLLLLLSVCKLLAQAPAIEWQQCYGSVNSNRHPSGIIQTADGNYVTCGYYSTSVTEDMQITKLSGPGTVIWQKYFGGDAFDYATSIRQTTDGGYIVAGTTYSNNSGDVGITHGGSDCWILKLNSGGDITWQKFFGGTADDGASFIQQTNDGGYIVSGYTKSTNGDVTNNHGQQDYWIIKLDNAGNISWQKTYGGSQPDLAYNIKQTPDGGYIVIGNSDSFDGDVIADPNTHGVWIIKLDAAGNIDWQKTYGGPLGYEKASGICLVNGGGYAFTGTSFIASPNINSSHGSTDFWLVRIDATGNIIWKNSFGGTHEDNPNQVIACDDGGFAVVGSVTSNDGNVSGYHLSPTFPIPFGSTDCWIIKLSSAGVLQWQKTLGGIGWDSGSGIFQTADHGFIVVGSTNSNDGDIANNPEYPLRDMWILKLAPSAVVPIVLGDFTAILKDKNVLCSWSTLQEQNSDYFMVERSYDGVHFAPIGSVAAAGNSSSTLYYNFNDGEATIAGNDYSYYRLKMIDLDGSIKLSGIVKIKIPHSNLLEISPNPVLDLLTCIFFSNNSETAILSVFDQVGKKLLEKTIHIKQGKNILSLNVASLPGGLYTLFVTGSTQYIRSFIKIK